MKIGELDNSDLELISRVDPRWVSTNRPGWMAKNNPEYMIRYHPFAMVKFNLEYVEHYHPDVIDECNNQRNRSESDIGPYIRSILEGALC